MKKNEHRPKSKVKGAWGRGRRLVTTQKCAYKKRFEERYK